MKKIPLGKSGKFSTVDDEEYAYLTQWKWNVLKNTSGNFYANRLSYKKGYKNRERVLMHRLINNTPEGMETDHINGNSLDNRRKNLRTVTKSQNMWNRKPNTVGKSKYKGVSFQKQNEKWRSMIQANKKRIFLGLFLTEIQAAEAYNEKATSLHGKFAKLNIIE